MFWKGVPPNPQPKCMKLFLKHRESHTKFAGIDGPVRGRAGGPAHSHKFSKFYLMGWEGKREPRWSPVPPEPVAAAPILKPEDRDQTWREKRSATTRACVEHGNEGGFLNVAMLTLRESTTRKEFCFASILYIQICSGGGGPAHGGGEKD